MNEPADPLFERLAEWREPDAESASFTAETWNRIEAAQRREPIWIGAGLAACLAIAFTTFMLGHVQTRHDMETAQKERARAYVVSIDPLLRFSTMPGDAP